MHHLVGCFFGVVVTPPGVGRDEINRNNNANGESDWRFEWELFGGNLMVEWLVGEENEWKLSKIHALLFELPNDGEIYSIPPSECNCVSSI